ncbi:MAG: hypothetical protein FWD89_01305 [Firmicutes bacterium]|nr:hypothetical protein [Bacillota bacterium]MCL2770929.1 hypothetical protein [Bacillota bacterium]
MKKYLGLSLILIICVAFFATAGFNIMQTNAITEYDLDLQRIISNSIKPRLDDVRLSEFENSTGISAAGHYVVGDKIYAVRTGLAMTTIVEFDTIDNTTFNSYVAPVTFSASSGTVVGNKIIYSRSSGNHPDLVEFDTVTKQFREMRAPVSVMFTSNAQPIDDKLYFITSTSSNIVVEIDTTNRTFRQFTAPENLSSTGTLSAGGKVYFGYTNNSVAERFMEFDPATGAFTNINAPAAIYFGNNATAFENQIYFISGVSGSARTLYVFNTTNRQFSTVTFPKSIQLARANIVGRKIYFTGTNTNSVIDFGNTVMELDVDTNHIVSTETPINFDQYGNWPRFKFQLGNKIYYYARVNPSSTMGATFIEFNADTKNVWFVTLPDHANGTNRIVGNTKAYFFTGTSATAVKNFVAFDSLVEIDAGVIMSELARISDETNQKMDDLEGVFGSLQTSLSGKADISALTPINTNISNLQSSLAGKADTTALTPINNNITSIQSVLGNKIEASDLATAINPINTEIEKVNTRIDNLPKPETVDLSPLEADISAVNLRIDNLPKPEVVDLTGLETDIAAVNLRIDNLPKPETVDLEPINTSISNIETTLGNKLEASDLTEIKTDIETLNTRIDELPEPKEVDLSGIITDIENLDNKIKNFPTPEVVDLTPLNNSISNMQTSLNNKLEASDLNDIKTDIWTINNKIDNLPKPEAIDLTTIETDIAGIQTSLEHKLELSDLTEIKTDIETLGTTLNSEIETLNTRIDTLPKPETVDLSGLEADIAAVNLRIDTLPEPEVVDLTPINTSISSLQSSMASKAENSALTPINSSISNIQSSLNNKLEAGDIEIFSSLPTEISRLDNRIDNIQTTGGVDLSPIEAEISRVEGDLASLASSTTFDFQTVNTKLNQKLDQADIASLESKMNTVSANAESLFGTITNAITSFDGKILTQSSTITALQNEVRPQLATLPGIEADISWLKATGAGTVPPTLIQTINASSAQIQTLQQEVATLANNSDSDYTMIIILIGAVAALSLGMIVTLTIVLMKGRKKNKKTNTKTKSDDF